MCFENFNSSRISTKHTASKQNAKRRTYAKSVAKEEEEEEDSIESIRIQKAFAFISFNFILFHFGGYGPSGSRADGWSASRSVILYLATAIEYCES